MDKRECQSALHGKLIIACRMVCAAYGMMCGSTVNWHVKIEELMGY